MVWFFIIVIVLTFVACFVYERNKRQSLREDIELFLSTQKEPRSVGEICTALAYYTTNLLWKVNQLPVGYEISDYEPNPAKVGVALEVLVEQNRVKQPRPGRYMLATAC